MEGRTYSQDPSLNRSLREQSPRFEWKEDRYESNSTWPGSTGRWNLFTFSVEQSFFFRRIYWGSIIDQRRDDVVLGAWAQLHMEFVLKGQVVGKFEWDEACRDPRIVSSVTYPDAPRRNIWPYHWVKSVISATGPLGRSNQLVIDHSPGDIVVSGFDTNNQSEEVAYRMAISPIFLTVECDQVRVFQPYTSYISSALNSYALHFFGVYSQNYPI